MSMARRLVHRLTFAFVFLVATLGPLHRGAKGEIVYDPWTYSQTYLAALRALQQVNNQLRELQTQLAMLNALQKTVTTSGQSLAPAIEASLAKYAGLTQSGNGIAFKVQETETAFQKLFPSQAQAASSNPAVKDAQSRWQEALAGFKRASVLEAATVEGIAADRAMLSSLLTRSRHASGALEAAQAGNELTGLQIKQSLQLQALLAAHGRANSFERARSLAAQGDAQARFKTFLGSGSAYSAARH
jgi:P-type conjugative transfer protein TrbJ